MDNFDPKYSVFNNSILPQLHARVEYEKPYCVEVALTIIEKYRGEGTMEKIVDKAMKIVDGYFDSILDAGKRFKAAKESMEEWGDGHIRR